MLLDLSAELQDYVEDCEVCCNPIQLVFVVAENVPVNFEARTVE